MKSIINKKDKKPEFPKLMENKDNGYIILARADETGVVVSDGGRGYVQAGDGSHGYLLAGVGDSITSYQKDKFIDFNGSITLSNE